MNEVIGAASNSSKVFCNGGGHLQDPGPGMPHESARYLEQSPAHGGDAMPLPALPQGGVFEQNKEVMGNDADPEKCSIGIFLTTRHPFHAKADFEFLDPVFRVFAAAPVPDQHIGGTASAVTGDDVVAGTVLFQEFSLMDMAHHDETEGFIGVLHAMHGLGHGTVGIVGSGGIGNRGDNRQSGGIQPAADGEGLARLFAVIWWPDRSPRHHPATQDPETGSVRNY